MSSREWWLRIQDILDAIAKIQRYTTNLTIEEFQAVDDMVTQAVLYNFVIIGEAIRNVPDSLQQRYPHIPWRRIAGTRNVVAHEYFQVNMAILWNTIQNDLPGLATQLEDLLDRELSDRQ
ncbi:HepT-like ribonuclease domain-containing protein [Leptolyngbya sp. AN03gr2]|uniref:HepT-like ribonuclease domain-containing protein n=1 Tax=unclassified Leptolyngbya TaxID=2650499 RepID=UPI003D313C5B